MENLMDVGGLAEVLRVKKSWIYDNYLKLGIPFVKVGKGVRFRPSEVERWLGERSAQGQ